MEELPYRINFKFREFYRTICFKTSSKIHIKKLFFSKALPCHFTDKEHESEFFSQHFQSKMSLDKVLYTCSSRQHISILVPNFYFMDSISAKKIDIEFDFLFYKRALMLLFYMVFHLPKVFPFFFLAVGLY